MNEDEQLLDYIWFLLIIVSLLFKINDELMYVRNSGGVRSFVDWPLYDEIAMAEFTVI